MPDQFDEFRKLLASAAKLARLAKNDASVASNPLIEKLGIRIAALYRAQARLAAKGHTDCAPSDEDGYVVHRRMLVPFYFLADIPELGALSELEALGHSLRVAEHGTLCLSGSGAMMGSLRFVGDLDYCEYVDCQAAPFAVVASRVDEHAVRSSAPLCQRLKTNASWAKAFPGDWTADLAKEIEQKLVGGERYLKLDFLARTAAVGVVEATNVALLLLDDGSRDATVRRSFAGQEIPLTLERLPRPLAEPLQLGNYLGFLLDHTKEYRDSATTKSLKRALCVARVLRLSEHGTAIERLLQEEPGALSAALTARTLLSEALHGITLPTGPRANTLQELLHDLADIIAELESRTGGQVSQDDWQERALEEIDALLATGGAVLAASGTLWQDLN